jgi:transposase
VPATEKEPGTMAREFQPHDLDQQYLLPPSLGEWVPEDRLIWFVSDLVDSLDLSAILAACDRDETRGRPSYHPVMMTDLLLYAYAMGKPSSRKIKRAC